MRLKIIVIFLQILSASSLAYGSLGEPHISNLSSKEIFSFYDRDARSLSIAAANGDISKIDFLKKKGVDFNAIGKYGMTPLFTALLAKNKEGVAALLRNGANPNHFDLTGASPLHIAVLYVEDTYFLELLLQYGGDANAMRTEDNSPYKTYKYDLDPHFQSPLHMTAIINPFLSGHSGISDNALKKADILLRYRADINIRNIRSLTPLMEAISVRNFDRAYFFVENGADCNIKSKNNHNASYFYNYLHHNNKKHFPAPGSIQDEWRKKFLRSLEEHCSDISHEFTH